MRFDGNRYSVPRRWAFRPVTVKGYVDRVEVVADGQVIATPRAQLRPPREGARSAAFPGGFGTQAGGPGPRPGLPRLATAGGVRRPRAATSKRGSGHAAGTRQYIRVLQLLAHHPRRARRARPSPHCQAGGDRRRRRHRRGRRALAAVTPRCHSMPPAPAARPSRSRSPTCPSSTACYPVPPKETMPMTDPNATAARRPT